MTALPVTKHRVLPGKQAKQVRNDLSKLRAAVEGAKSMAPGRTGPAVESLQRLMKGLNLYSGPANGTFDAATAAAVAKLEARAGVATPDGVIDGKEVGNLAKSQLFLKDGFVPFSVKGQKGSDILRMEKQLSALGYKTGAVDGFYDANTAKAVRKFRLDEKTVPNLTGNYAGGMVKKALNREVRELERDLKTLGAKVGKVDGTFTEATEKAVRTFQRKHDMKVTGVASERTRALVDKAADKKEGGTTKKFIDIALAQRGKPYVWGAEGPRSFDCSGLVCYALNQAGVKVPRLTADGYMNMYAGSRVSRDNLKPGDLLFYGTPGNATHIEIYLGNGKSMGTDNPSEGARVESVNWSALIAASRVPALSR